MKIISPILCITISLFIACVSSAIINVEPGTYDNIACNPGDSVIFYPGVYVLPVTFHLVEQVAYIGNGSIIKNSQTWVGANEVAIYGFTYVGTILNFGVNQTGFQIVENTFYAVTNSSSSAIINLFGNYQAFIINNTFYGFNEQQLAISVAQSTDVVIANNSFYATAIQFQIYSLEYNVEMNYTAIIISENCFWNVSGQAILVFVGISGPYFSAAIVNNTIYSYHSKLPDFTRAFNIQLQDSQFIVTGNYLSPAEASGALCNFCTPIVIQTNTVPENSTISWNTIGGNAWSYYVECFDTESIVPVEDNFFYGSVSPPITKPCGAFSNTILPRDSIPPPPSCW